MVKFVTRIKFPEFSSIRCLMMPYVQGEPSSVPDEYAAYRGVLENLYLKRGDIGYLTIDESRAIAGRPHRGARAKHGRALHTEAGRVPGMCGGGWGGGGWGAPSASRYRVLLGEDTRILLANNLDDSCAVWDAEHTDTTADGDIGHLADLYPYSKAVRMKAGEVCEIGIFTPHESLPVRADCDRQFLRIVGSPVLGREEYFTENPLM